ncbi:MAG: tetratricopeptide repeat protein, partial [bacterium]
MRARSAIAVAATALFALPPAARAAELPVNAELRDRLLSRIAAGDADSARAIVRADRNEISEVVEALLFDRARHLVGGRADSAAVHLEQAQVVSRAYADALGDSSCIRRVELHERLGASNRRDTLVAAWTRYADTLALRPEWAKVRTAIPAVLDGASRATDPYLELRVRRLAIRCLLLTGSAAEARAECGLARELARSLGDRTTELHVQSLLARALLTEDRLAEALAVLEEVLESARLVEDWYVCLWTASSIVTCRLHLGDAEAARPAVEDGLALARREKQRRWEGEFLGHSATLLGLAGRYSEAIERREEARRIQRELALAGPELDSIIMLAWLYGSQERYSQALALMHEGLAIAERTGIVEAIAILHGQIGETWMRLGRPDEALRHYEDVLPAARSLGAPRHEALVLHGIGMAHLALDEPAEALPWFERAWEAIRGRDLVITAGEILPDLARAYEETGNREQAGRHFEMARAAAEELGNAYLVGEAERGLGRVLAAGADADRARDLFASAIARGRAIGVPALLRDALTDAADLCVATGRPEEADTLLAEALEIVESVRAGEGGAAIRLGFLTDKKAIYARRVEVLCELGRDQEAFAVSERARARTLLDVLAGAAGEVGGHVEPALRDEERRLSARLREAQTVLSEAVSAETWEDARVDSLERAVEEAGREYRAVLDEISARDPAWGALAGGRAPLRLDEVRTRVLREGQVLVEYLVAGDRGFVFLASPDRFRVARLAASEDSLEALVNRLRASVAAGALDPDGARELFDILLRPVAADIAPGARVLVVPDGPLFHVPFALLRDEAGIILERNPLVYAPSASTLDPDIRAASRRRQPSLLAVGNPATFRSETLLSSVRGAEKWRFGELPYSAEESRR